jgi:hypothetical protein
MLVTLDYTLEVEKWLGDSLCAALELASFVSDNLHKTIKDSYEQTILKTADQWRYKEVVSKA